MSDIAKLIADMARAGVDPELIGRAAAALAEREPVLVADEQAERRRAADRERKRLRKSAESAESAEVVSPKKEPSPAPLKEKTTPSSEPNGSSKKPTRLPADFAFPAEWRQWAIARGLPADRCDLEFTKLVNWAANAPGSKGAKRDWFKAWQNWALTAIDQLPNARGSPARQQQPKGSDFFDIEAERLRNERAGNGRSDQGNWDDAQGFSQLTIEHHR